MNAPVVLFVYNRLDHTMNVIESLAGNVLAGETDLYVFSDAAKTEKGLDKVNAVREYIRRTDWRGAFRKVTVVEAEQNKGLAKSIIGGVTKILEEYGKVIVVEDDLVLSPYFLNYMNGALDYYKDVPDVWSISGYSFPMKSLKNYPHDVFYSYRGCSWGWATWLDRWVKTDWEVKDYPKLMSDKEWQKRFNRGGADLTGMLDMQMEGKINSWAIRWVFTQSNLDMYTVYPKNSYILNDGCDGSGTHVGTTNEYSTDISDGVSNCKFERLEIDQKIAREFWYKYSDTLDKKIKRNLKKIFRKR
ncbi:MAG: sugar transferase [Lachnospiraceae bacterium]|nr:sugar transferase [Lachnospiraceae bacterium]